MSRLTDLCVIAAGFTGIRPGSARLRLNTVTRSIGTSGSGSRVLPAGVSQAHTVFSFFFICCRGGRNEAHIPAKCPPTGTQAWIPCPYEHERRSRRDQGSSCEGTRPAVGVIRSIRQRRDFDYLHRAGTRLRPTVDAEVNRSMWCVYAPPRADDSPNLVSIAFAIGRPVGPAVTRNRLRRRLRGLIRSNQASDGSVPAGWYLFGASPSAARLTRRQFADAVGSLLTQVERRSGVGHV